MKEVLKAIALMAVVPMPSCVVPLGVLVALGGEISVPFVVVGVLPSVV